MITTNPSVIKMLHAKCIMPVNPIINWTIIVQTEDIQYVHRHIGVKMNLTKSDLSASISAHSLTLDKIYPSCIDLSNPIISNEEIMEVSNIDIVFSSSIFFLQLYRVHQSNQLTLHKMNLSFFYLPQS